MYCGNWTLRSRTIINHNKRKESGDGEIIKQTIYERRKRQILDMLRGNINRISVSTDVEEIVCQLNFAVDRLSAVAYSRIKEIRDGYRNDD